VLGLGTPISAAGSGVTGRWQVANQIGAMNGGIGLRRWNAANEINN